MFSDEDKVLHARQILYSLQTTPVVGALQPLKRIVYRLIHFALSRLYAVDELILSSLSDLRADVQQQKVMSLQLADLETRLNELSKGLEELSLGKTFASNVKDLMTAQESILNTLSDLHTTIQQQKVMSLQLADLETRLNTLNETSASLPADNSSSDHLKGLITVARTRYPPESVHVYPYNNIARVQHQTDALNSADLLLLYSLVFSTRPSLCMTLDVEDGTIPYIIVGALDALNMGHLICSDTKVEIILQGWDDIGHRATMLENISPENVREITDSVGPSIDLLVLHSEYPDLQRCTEVIAPFTSPDTYILLHGAQLIRAQAIIKESFASYSRQVTDGAVLSAISGDSSINGDNQGDAIHSGLCLLRSVQVPLV